MNPKYITVHCSATRPCVKVDSEVIRRWHVEKGWSDCGYHFVVLKDGNVEEGRPISRTGAHVKGYNKSNIGICLAGGLDIHGKPAFTYAVVQMDALRALITELVGIHGIKQENIKGHRDWPKVAKDCPCFDVQSKLKEWM